MNREIFINSKLVENLGWTLVHSIWQIALIALILFLVLRIFNKLSANARYLFAATALGFAFVLPFVTLVELANDSAQNKSSDKISIVEDIDSLNNKAQPAENLSPSANYNLQTADSKNENAFFSFANLQKHFKQNVASALPMFVLLWMFGVGIFAFRLCGGIWQLHQYKTREISLPDEDWRERFSALCEAANRADG